MKEGSIFMKKVKGFSYDTDKDQDVIHYLNTKDNFSSFLLQLVRQEMKHEGKLQYVIDYVYSKIHSDTK